MFNVEITFSGAIGYVFNPDDTKMMAVIPDGRDATPKSKKAIDGTNLKTHFAFMKINGANIKNNKLNEDVDIIKYLNRLRVSFKSNPEIDFEPRMDGSAYDASRVPLMVNVSDEYSEINKNVIENPASNAGVDASVLTQILVNSGMLCASDFDGNFLYEFIHSHKISDFLNGEDSVGIKNILKNQELNSMTLSPGFKLNFKDIEKFYINLTSLNDGTEFDPIEIVPTSTNSDVQILIANHCFGNPLDWEGFGNESSGYRDDDFKWIFELTKNRDGLKRSLDGYHLPIPVVTDDLGAGGQPSRCMGAIYSPEQIP